jgi:hypothetical protein
MYTSGILVLTVWKVITKKTFFTKRNFKQIFSVKFSILFSRANWVSSFQIYTGLVLGTLDWRAMTAQRTLIFLISSKKYI